MVTAASRLTLWQMDKISIVILVPLSTRCNKISFTGNSRRSPRPFCSACSSRSGYCSLARILIRRPHHVPDLFTARLDRSYGSADLYIQRHLWVTCTAAAIPTMKWKKTWLVFKEFDQTLFYVKPLQHDKQSSLSLYMTRKVFQHVARIKSIVIDRMVIFMFCRTTEHL